MPASASWHRPLLRMVHHSIDSLTDLVTNDVVVDFVKTLELRNYRRCTQEQQEEIAAIYQTAFGMLSASRDDPARWEQTIDTIVCDLFRKDDPDAWFHRFYVDYMKNIKPEVEFEQIRGHIKGDTILDFGCGGAYLALRCREEGFNVLTTDVVDWRIDEAKDLPFTPMRGDGTIPYADDSASTALVFAVLHHIDASDLEKVLSSLRRVSARVIIREDVYGIPLDNEGFGKVLEEDELLREFMLLREVDQLRVLMLHDYVDNAFAQGIPEMNFPFQFKTIPEWSSTLAANGFTSVKTTLVGFKRTTEWTGTCHALLIADRD